VENKLIEKNKMTTRCRLHSAAIKKKKRTKETEKSISKRMDFKKTRRRNLFRIAVGVVGS